MRPQGFDEMITDVELRRPAAGLAAQGATGVGSLFAFAIAEMALDGTAEVTAVRPCPALATGSGRVVTMTVTHLNTAVLRLTVVGQDLPIGTTVYHPFYSETAGGWVKAQDLRIGDVLRTASGTARLLATVRQPGESRVYNLEVEAEHVYYVGAARLLVHNGCGVEPGKGGLASEANGAKTTPVASGAGRAAKRATPNSIYEQLGDSGEVRSRTWYDDNGHTFARQDFDHSHAEMQPHEHLRDFDEGGRPTTKEEVRELPSGYDDNPTSR